MNTQADLVKNLENLEPTVRALADVGPDLSILLGYVPTFPFTQNFTDRAVRGDYFNVFAVAPTAAGPDHDPYPLDPNLISQGVPPDDRVTVGDNIFGPVEGTPSPPALPGPRNRLHQPRRRPGLQRSRQTRSIPTALVFSLRRSLAL